MAKPHPLESFAAQGAGAGNFRLEKLPSLGELTTNFGFKDGIRRFDEELEKWRQNTERQLREQFTKAQPIPSSELG